MKHGILFLLILFMLRIIAYCDDIIYETTQDTIIEQGLFQRTNVSKGDTVFFQGKTDFNFTINEYMILVRTERGQEGLVNVNHVLLQDTQPLSDSIITKHWIYSYYQDVIYDPKKETLFKYEPFWRDDYDDYVKGDYHMSDISWWHFFYPTHFDIRNNLMYIRDIFVGDYIGFVYTKVQQNTTVIIFEVICEGKNNYHSKNYLNKNFNEGESYRLILKIDGDYMDVFINDETTKLCTLIGVDEYFVETVNSIVKGEVVDLTRIVWPRRSDGSMDSFSTSSPNTSEEAKQPEPVDLSVDSSDTENQRAIQNTPKTSSIPLWALFAIIGGAVVIAGRAVVFAVKLRK
jgi:hypothetical protein